jgi:hypothetical protein
MAFSSEEYSMPTPRVNSLSYSQFLHKETIDWRDAGWLERYSDFYKR